MEVLRFGPPGTGRLGELAALAAMWLWLVRRRRAVRVFQSVMWVDAPLAATASKLLRRTMVVWAGDGDVTDSLRSGSLRRRLVTRARRRMFARCRHVALTGAIFGELEQVALADRASVIPTVVDTAFFRPPAADERREARSKLGLDCSSFVIVYVGHLRAIKGIDRLLEAFRLIAEEDSGARLLIVGDDSGAPDDCGDALRAQAAEADSGQRVMFCGKVQDPRAHLWSADVFVLPSTREGMPNSILEALACGLPTVAPASAGGAALLDGCGVVPASNSPADLVRALRELRDDPNRCADLAAKARLRALEFDATRVIAQYEELYAQVSLR